MIGAENERHRVNEENSSLIAQRIGCRASGRLLRSSRRHRFGYFGRRCLSRGQVISLSANDKGHDLVGHPAGNSSRDELVPAGSTCWSAVFGGVVKFDFAARTLFGRIDDAGIERMGINMQTDRARVEVPWITDAVHWLFGVDSTWMVNIHLDDVGRLQPTLTSFNLLLENPVVFDL